MESDKNLQSLVKILKAMQIENKRLRSLGKHFITKDGRHMADYSIRCIEMDVQDVCYCTPKQLLLYGCLCGYGTCGHEDCKKQTDKPK